MPITESEATQKKALKQTPLESTGYYPRVNVETTTDFAEEKTSGKHRKVRIHLEIPFKNEGKWDEVKEALEGGEFQKARDIVLEETPTDGNKTEVTIARALIFIAMTR